MAGREPGGRVQAGCRVRPPELSERRDAVAEPYKPGAAQSAEQSCAARAAAGALPPLEAQRDAERLVLAALKKL